ncbi:uncharacterized protein BDW70DRAFT_152449 [Aspergillus foveolatus]|uniref:uncharacterized protein n=1 Tax=Aspergillus foveolatus TaxID=210207 RepID=UPI003CCCC335
MHDDVPHTTARKFTACDVCYRRKIKCDGIRPRCNWCLHQQLDCTYRRPFPRKGAKRTAASSTAANRASLIERIRRLDERRTDAMSSDINDCQAGAPNLLPEGLRWIKSRTGIALSLPTTHHSPWEKPPSSTDNLDLWPNGTALELPTKPILKQYLDAYLSSLMHKVFPVVDSSLFPLTIQAAYQQRVPGHQSPNPSARACVFAFTALVSCLGQVDPGSSVARPPPVPCREYIMQARRILPAIVQEPPNLDAVQTTLQLALISVITGELQIAVYYTSIASRFIIASGAHTMTDALAPTSTPGVIAKKHLRTLFWLCYTLDKDLALRTGQAHVLKDDDCALDIPPAYHEHLHSCLDHSPGTDADIRGPIFPVDLRLSMIKARAFTALYSYNGLRKSDAELIRSIRELDEELECWRTSLPPHLRPQLSFMPKHEKPKNTFLILTHMSYYSCVNLIHLASSRCNAWRSPSLDGGALIHGLQSSLTVSVEASRSLLLFLRDSEFRRPDADNVESDMKLLTLAEQTTGRLFLRRNNPMDRVIDLAPINEFISWLRKHAERAI